MSVTPSETRHGRLWTWLDQRIGLADFEKLARKKQVPVHRHAFWYYLGVIATGWLPLTLTLPWVWPRWRERFAARDAKLLLPLIWVALVIVFFSFPKGKRDVYILPALPCASIREAVFTVSPQTS